MPSAKHKTKAPPPVVAAGFFTIVENPDDLKVGDLLYIPDYVRFSNSTASSYDISNGDTSRSDNRASLVANLFGSLGPRGARYLLATDVLTTQCAATRSVAAPTDLTALLSDNADIGFDIHETGARVLVAKVDWRVLAQEDFRLFEQASRELAMGATSEDGLTHAFGSASKVGSVPVHSRWLEDAIVKLAAELGLKDACIRCSQYRDGDNHRDNNQPNDPDDLAHAIVNGDIHSFFDTPGHLPDVRPGEYRHLTDWQRRNGYQSSDGSPVSETIKRVVHETWQEDTWRVDSEKKLVTRRRFLPNLLRKGAIILRRTGDRTLMDEFAAAAMDLRAQTVARLCHHAATCLASMRETLDAAVVRYDDLGDQWKAAATAAVGKAPDMNSVFLKLFDPAFVAGETRYGAKS